MRFMWHALSVICSKSKESSENENGINSRRLTQTPQTFLFFLARTSAEFCTQTSAGGVRRRRARELTSGYRSERSERRNLGNSKLRG